MCNLSASRVCASVCVDTMLNVAPAARTLRGRRSLAVDKNNKPREAPGKTPSHTGSGSQTAASTGGNNQNLQLPPPDLVRVTQAASSHTMRGGAAFDSRTSERVVSVFVISLFPPVCADTRRREH